MSYFSSLSPNTFSQLEAKISKPERKLVYIYTYMGFPGGSVVKNLPADEEDTDSVPGPGRPPGEGNGKPTLVFLPGNPMDRGA